MIIRTIQRVAALPIGEALTKKSFRILFTGISLKQMLLTNIYRL
jgi:hypothetical protein